MTEPVSVRIAKLRGCDPVEVSEGLWYCEDGRWGPGHVLNSLDVRTAVVRGMVRPCLSRPEYEAWLTPAAAFALLSEMVDAEALPQCSVSGFKEPERKYECAYYPRASSRDMDAAYAPTLGEAIALAWCAWKEARQ